MSPYRYPVIETAQIETTFLELAEQWRRETGMLNLISKISMHPAYQRIIGIGQPVVPLIMRELENEPDHWFWALSAITGAKSNPNSVVDSTKWLKLGLNGEERMDTDGKLESYKENRFPNLSRTEYSVTSKQTTSYNCFAWAAGEEDR